MQGKAFAVDGRPDERGVVASCSYAARAHGAGPVLGLLIVPPRFDAYHRASHQVMEKLRALTPQVEQISIDEAFLDVNDLPEALEVLAHQRLSWVIAADEEGAILAWASKSTLMTHTQRHALGISDHPVGDVKAILALANGKR